MQNDVSVRETREGLITYVDAFLLEQHLSFDIFVVSTLGPGLRRHNFACGYKLLDV